MAGALGEGLSHELEPFPSDLKDFLLIKLRLLLSNTKGWLSEIGVINILTGP